MSIKGLLHNILKQKLGKYGNTQTGNTKQPPLPPAEGAHTDTLSHHFTVAQVQRVPHEALWEGVWLLSDVLLIRLDGPVGCHHLVCEHTTKQLIIQLGALLLPIHSTHT